MTTYSDTFSGSGALGVTEVGGQAWTVVTGSWSRSGGYANTSTSGSSNPIAVIDVGIGDADVSLDVSSGGGDCLYFRVQDANSWWRLRVEYYSTSTPTYTTQYQWGQYYYDNSVPSGNYGSANDPYTAYGWGTYSTPPDFSYLNNEGYTLLNTPFKTGSTQQVQSGSDTTYYHYVRLEKCTAGSVSTVATYSVTGTSLRIVTSGSTITPYVNGAAKAAVTDSAFSTISRFGIGRGSSSYNASAIDNFSVSPSNSAPYAPAPTSPANNATIDDTTPETFSWVFSDPDSGDSQSAFDLQWWPLDAPGGNRTASATMVSGNTANSFYTFPAAYFADGNYEWQVRTYDRLNTQGPWSASRFFAAATPTGVPTITDPTNGATIGTQNYTVAWSTAGGQAAYRVRRVADDGSGNADSSVVYYDSGQVASSGARTALVPFETNLRYEHVQLQVSADGTLWSSWADARVHVSYTGPTAPVVTGAPDPGTGSLLFVINNPTPIQGADEQQQVAISGSPTGGTFTLTYSGQTTSPLAYNATVAAVQSALEALSNIGTGNLSVGGTDGQQFNVGFTGALANADVSQMTATSSLTGGTSPTVTVTTLVEGRAASNPATAYNNVYVDDGLGKGKEMVATMLSTNTAWRYMLPVSGRDYSGNAWVEAVGTNGVTTETAL